MKVYRRRAPVTPPEPEPSPEPEAEHKPDRAPKLDRAPATTHFLLRPLFGRKSA